MHRRLAAAMTLALVGLPLSSCGTQQVWQGDPELYGVRLEVSGQRPWTERADFTDRLRRVIELGAARWGIDPAELAGWRILFRERGADGIACGGDRNPHIDGCTDDADHTITITVDGWHCVEETPLAHEIGHVAMLRGADGDPGHRDARWWDDSAWGKLWDTMADRLPSPDGAVARCFVKGSYPRVERWTGLGN